tara:strand:+ start:60 stop:701 length:642 start_codon:yes stop_codon:yes gene_type:complete
MALKRKSPQQENTNSNVEYTNLEAGEHEGRLVYIADLGLQKNSYKGEEKPDAQQIALGIEILGSSVTIDGVEKPRFLWTRPFYIYQSMSERGIELQMYKAFNTTAMEGEIADWDTVMGMPCNVIVKHQVSGDRTYDNIDTITSIPAKYHDTIADARIKDMSIGDSDDENNPAQKAMFGLTRWRFEQRLDAASSPKLSVVKPDADDDFEDDIPF